MIPADCLLIEDNSLSTDESSLTGETFPVEKLTTKIPANTSLSERKNSLWMGTHVISGSGKAIIVNLAKDTEFGKITSSLSQKDSDTDFEKGFIRAETVSYEDLVSSGSMVKAKELGLVRSEGKDYVMKDGDVVLFRFNI